MSAPLLVTKIMPPPPRQPRVARPRLVARLRAGLRGPLTLLSAPPGFGKTTAAREALEEPPGVLAWLALDAADNDPTRFARYLVAAIGRAAPGVDAALGPLLGAPQPLPLEMALTLLLNELAALDQPVVLALDDFHLLENPVILAAMAGLVERLPPALRLVIATREDPPLPLARLRARGQITEARAADLRFTADEAAAFLADVMGLTLSPADVAALEARTEGWVAGLQLAALSLRDLPDPGSFIAALRGTHAHIVDYLMDEALAHQPPDVQSFLLHTAILDRLCGPLCDAVMGLEVAPETDGLAVSTATGQAMLERLERANLFLIPLDAERRWHRYHHLFADLLRARLAALPVERVRTLHARASAWHARRAADDPASLADAVRHALDAEDMAGAAALLEEHGPALVARGELALLEGWLTRLPASLVDGRPGLAIIAAWVDTLTSRRDQAERHLRAAEATLAAGSDPGLVAFTRGSVAAIRAYAAVGREDFPTAIASGLAALDQLPASAMTTRVATHLIVGISQVYTDDLAAAGTHLRQATTLGLASANPYAALSAAAMLGQALLSMGRPREAVDHARGMIAMVRLPNGQSPPIAADLHTVLGEALREWNDLDGAAVHLEQAVALAERLGSWWTLQSSATALAWTLQTRGDGLAALALLERVAALSPAPANSPERRMLTDMRVRLWLVQGDLDAARRWAEALAPPGAHPPEALPASTALTLARALIALDRPGDALPLLASQAVAAARAGRLGPLIAVRALEALASQALGDTPRALTTLAAALRLGEPENYLRSFLDEGPAMTRLLRLAAARGQTSPLLPVLLAAAGEDASPDLTRAASALPEPLTERERAFLPLLAAGLSNAEIAAELFLTVGTVKWYLNQIYGKLGARSRVQAVARARELGLLP